MSGSMALMPTRGRAQTLEAVKTATGGAGFDADAWHVIEQRDNALIADEVLNGTGSSKFVYEFSLGGSNVSGISVIGARHLAAAYGGIRHRLVASVQKIGALHTFTSYPAPGMPMDVHTQILPELADEDDYYSAICEISDIKTGVSVQSEKREARFETKKNGDRYERSHYATIAQSKAYRNGVLTVIAQDVQLKWKMEMLRLGKNDVITGSLMEEKRSGVLRFAAAKAIAVDRQRVEALTLDQIAGLSDAARAGLAEFTASAQSLRVMDAVAQAVGDVAGRLPAAAATPSAKPASTGAPPSTAPERKAFRHFVVDAEGEVMSDELGDPGVWAETFLLAWDSAGGDQVLLENNAEALGEVRAFPNAAALLAKVGVGDAPDMATELAMPRGSRGADVTGWIKQARDVMGRLNAEKMAEWIGNNGPVWSAFPPSKRLEVEKMVAARCAELGLSWSGLPGKTADSALPHDQPAHLANPTLWADQQMAALDPLQSAEDVRSLQGRLSVRMEAIKGTAAYDRLELAFRHKLEKLARPADDAGPKPE